MKEIYELPNTEVIMLDPVDIIATSDFPHFTIRPGDEIIRPTETTPIYDK